MADSPPLNDPLLRPTSTDSSSDAPLSLTPWRFWAVGLFALISAMQNVVWICFSVIQAPTQCYYSLPGPDPINLLVGLGALIFCPFVVVSTGLVDRLGLRPVVVLGTFFLGAGAAIRLVSLVHKEWAWVVVGQIMNGIAGPVVMAAPTSLSTSFFPANERTTATAVAWLAQPVGLSLGFVLGPAIVDMTNVEAGLPTLLWVEAGLGIALSLLVLFTFPNAPKHAPSRSAQVTKQGMSWAQARETLRLCTRPSYVTLTLAWGISGGVFTGWQTLLDLFLDDELQVRTGECG